MSHFPLVSSHLSDKLFFSWILGSACFCKNPNSLRCKPCSGNEANRAMWCFVYMKVTIYTTPSVGGWTIAPSDVLMLIPRTCVYVTLHGKRDSADVTKLRIWRWRDDSGWSSWAWSSNDSHFKRGAAGSEVGSRPRDNRSYGKHNQKKKILALRMERGTTSQGMQATSRR